MSSVTGRWFTRNCRRIASKSAPPTPLINTHYRRNHSLDSARSAPPSNAAEAVQWTGGSRSAPGQSRTRRGPVKSKDQLPQSIDIGAGASVDVAWSDVELVLSNHSSKESHSIQPTQLLDSCMCKLCRDTSSGQKSFATADIPTDTVISNVVAGPGNSLVISLRADSASTEHVVNLSSERIAKLVTKRRDEGISARLATRRRFGVVNWDTATYDKKFGKIEYEEYMQDGSVFWKAIRDLARWGVVFLKNVPCEEDSIVKIATRIANIRETFYGRTFDVKAKPRAENVAYTSGYLGLHQDLLYLEPPPHIQVLHCMENSCQGGESLFSDGDRIARMLWQLRDQHPVRSLVDVPVPYAYDRNGYRYRQERPMLVGETGLDGIEVFRNFFWSPPFQGVFDKPVDMTSWIEAAKIFESLVNAEDAVYKTKMEPGDAVLFDNLRVLHGRTAFDAEGGGSRWLRGTYIDAQDFFSTASHAPDTHAADGKNEDALWDEQRHMEDLARSPWYSSLLERMASRA